MSLVKKLSLFLFVVPAVFFGYATASTPQITVTSRTTTFEGNQGGEDAASRTAITDQPTTTEDTATALSKELDVRITIGTPPTDPNFDPDNTGLIDLIASSSVQTTATTIFQSAHAETRIGITYMSAYSYGGDMNVEVATTFTLDAAARIHYQSNVPGHHGGSLVAPPFSTGHVQATSFGESDLTGPSGLAGTIGGTIGAGYDLHDYFQGGASIGGSSFYSRDDIGIASAGTYTLKLLGYGDASISYSPGIYPGSGAGGVDGIFGYQVQYPSGVATNNVSFYALEDIDMNGAITQADLTMLAANYGGDPGRYDVNQDGVVDAADHAAVSAVLNSN